VLSSCKSPRPTPCCLTLSINRRVPLVHDQQDKPPPVTAWLQAGTAPEGPAWAGVPSLNGKQVRAEAFSSQPSSSYICLRRFPSTYRQLNLR
jgi:hypothetical protein